MTSSVTIWIISIKSRVGHLCQTPVLRSACALSRAQWSIAALRAYRGRRAGNGTLSYRRRVKAIGGALLGSIELERLPSKNLSIKRSLSRQLIVSSSSVNRTNPQAAAVIMPSSHG